MGLVRLYCLDHGTDWLALTPDDHYDGSANGRALGTCRVDDRLKIVPAEQLDGDFHRDFCPPGLLSHLFAQRTRNIIPPA